MTVMIANNDQKNIDIIKFNFNDLSKMKRWMKEIYSTIADNNCNDKIKNLPKSERVSIHCIGCSVVCLVVVAPDSKQTAHKS